MSGRAPRPDADSGARPPSAGATREAREKARILIPIAIAVAGLLLFLILFWPDGHHGRKGGSRGGHQADREDSRSPIGGSAREDRRGRGSSEGTGDGPIGGGASRAPRAKGETWWYQGGDKAGGGKDRDGWWYKDGGSTEKQRPESGDEDSPVGGSLKPEPTQEAKSDGKSGPDNDWWHD